MWVIPQPGTFLPECSTPLGLTGGIPVSWENLLEHLSGECGGGRSQTTLQRVLSPPGGVCSRTSSRALPVASLPNSVASLLLLSYPAPHMATLSSPCSAALGLSLLGWPLLHLASSPVTYKTELSYPLSQEPFPNNPALPDALLFTVSDR